MRSYEKGIDGAVSERNGQPCQMRSGGERDSEMIERLSRVLAVFALLGGTAWAGSMNGVAGSMPAYYDDTLFTITFMELASSGEAANVAHNGSINTIYIYGAYLRKAGGEHEDLLPAHSARGARGNLLRTDIRPAID